MGFVVATLSLSAYEKFVNNYGDPFDILFSPKIEVSLLILIPIIDIILTQIIRYFCDNKDENFYHIDLSDENAIKLYKKDRINNAYLNIVMLVCVYFCSYGPASGGRTISVYLFEDLFITGIFEEIRKHFLYKKYKKTLV